MAKSAFSSISIPVTDIKVVTPACYEAVLDSRSPFTPNQDYNFVCLDRDINNFYNSYDILTEKIYVPKQGEVIVVCHPCDHRWYRAKMLTTVETTRGYRANVQLIDINRKANVPFESVRKIHEKFSAYTPRGVTLELLGLIPCSLKYNALTLTLEPRTNEKWDTHAYTFVDSLLKRSEAAFFTVLGVISPEKYLGELHLQLRGELKCLNKLLVEKQYAFLQEIYDESCVKDHDDVPLGGSATTYQKVQPPPIKQVDTTPIQCRPCSTLEEEWKMMQEELCQKARDLDCDVVASVENDVKQNSSSCPDAVGHGLGEPTKTSPPQRTFLSPEAKVGAENVSYRSPSEGSQRPNRQTSPPIALARCSDDRVKRYSLPRMPSPVQYSETERRIPNDERRVEDASEAFDDSLIEFHVTDVAKSDREMKLMHSIMENNECTRVLCNISPVNRRRPQRLSPSEFLKKLKLSPPLPFILPPVQSELEESAKSIMERSKKNVSKNSEVANSTLLPSHLETNSNRRDCNGEGTISEMVASGIPSTKPCDVLEELVPLSATIEPKEIVTTFSFAECIASQTRSSITRSNVQITRARCPLGRGQILKEMQRKLGSESCENRLCGRYLEHSRNIEASLELVEKDLVERDAVRHSSTHRFYVTPPTNPNFSTSMDDPLGLDNKSFRKILVCGQSSPKPVLDISKASFNSLIVGRLKSCKIEYPATIQSYVWPAVMRGRNVSVISGPRSGKTYSYLLPLLSFILDSVMYKNLPAGNEPIALVLCAFWQSATRVYDMFMDILHGCQTVHVLLIHGGGYDETQKVQLINGCDILIATPCAILRILRGDGNKPTSFNRLCHLILDETDILMEDFTSELKELIEEYADVLRRRKLRNLPCQILTFGCKWTPGLRSFMANIMPNPLFFCSSFCESIIFAGIKTIAHTFSLHERSEKLIDLLRPNLNGNSMKIIICTSNIETARDLHHSMSFASKCSNIHLATEDMSPSEVLRVGESWKVCQPLGQQPILIATDGCLEELNIEDADCLIHYDIPALYKSNFGLRFSCLLKHMQRVSITERCPESEALCVTHIITTSECVLQAHGLIQLLKRLSSQVPTPLLSLALGYYQGGEEKKEPVPLCFNIKAFGQCSNQYWCKERHIILPTNDKPSDLLARGGRVVLYITDVRHATWYFARIIKYQNVHGVWEHAQPIFLTLHSKMATYFVKQKNRVVHSHPKVGDFCAVIGKDNGYYRARVLEAYVKASTNIRMVRVLLIDLGRISMVEVTELLQLPPRLASCPPQAVEVFLCNLRPIDKDYAWTNKACSLVDNLIFGKEVVGKVALCLGHVIWLSSLVRHTKLHFTRECVPEFSLWEKLIGDQFAIDNPKHLLTLECLAQEALTLPPSMEITSLGGGGGGGSDDDSEITLNAEYAFLPLRNDEVVYVSCLQNPGRFYVIKVFSYICLENLMNELEDYKKENPEPVQHIIVGMFCVAVLPSDGNFYRGRVIEILHGPADSSSSIYVRIFYVDYGDISIVKATCVYPLDHKYVWKLPFQAIECSLAHIAPLQASGWTEEASNLMWKNTFQDEEYKKTLTIKALKKNSRPSVSGGLSYEVELYDVTPGLEVNFSDWLCSNCHAMFTNSIKKHDGETKVCESCLCK